MQGMPDGRLSRQRDRPISLVNEAIHSLGTESMESSLVTPVTKTSKTYIIPIQFPSVFITWSKQKPWAGVKTSLIWVRMSYSSLLRPSFLISPRTSPKSLLNRPQFVMSISKMLYYNCFSSPRSIKLYYLLGMKKPSERHGSPGLYTP